MSRRRLLTRGGAVALGAGAAMSTPWPLRLGARAQTVDLDWLDDLPLLRTDALGQVSELLTAPLSFSAVGVRAPADAEVRVRTAGDDGAWSDWRLVPRTIDEGPDQSSAEHTGVAPRAPVWAGAGRRIQVASAGGDLGDVSLLLIDSVGLDGLAALTGDGGLVPVAPGGMAAAHAVGGPAIITRPEWGAAAGGGPRYASSVRFALVHHTVTSNSYGPGEAPGIVRAIQRHHMQGNGWGDIGYNFLVDRHGQVFEGRRGGMDRPVVGAHAAGFNAGSTGIALIGDHRGGGVTAAALDSLAHLLAWLCDLHGIDPHATTVETSGGSTRYPSGARARFDCISGHRDASRTSCPGQASYQELDAVRDDVAARLQGGTSGSEPQPGGARLGRLGGQDAVATAVLISRAAFGNGEAAHAVVVNDRVFADAATAGPLAGSDGPVLLTRPGRLDERVRDELERVLPRGATVYLLGGLTALSPLVATELAQRWRVRRMAGLNRTSTAAVVAERVVANRGNRTALVTRAGPDSAWSDTLAAGAYGARYGTPLLLTDSDRLSPATRAALTALGIEHTIVIGGTGAVSGEVMRQLPDPRRVAGSGRAGTAAAVASELWGSVDGVVVAGGYRASAWKDPLVVAPLAARRNAPVALVDVDMLPPATEQCLATLSDRGVSLDDGFVVGGRAAVSDGVAVRCARTLS